MGGVADAPEIFERVTIIGIGLIGASMALAARRGGRVGSIVAYDASPDVRGAGAGTRVRRCRGRTRGRGRARRRPRRALRPGRRHRQRCGRDRTSSRAGRRFERRGLGQDRGRRGRVAPPSEGHQFRPGTSGGGNRVLRSRCRVRGAVRKPLVHPHALRGFDRRRGRARPPPMALLRRHGRYDDAGPS